MHREFFLVFHFLMWYGKKVVAHKWGCHTTLWYHIVFLWYVFTIYTCSYDIQPWCTSWFIFLCVKIGGSDFSALFSTPFFCLQLHQRNGPEDQLVRRRHCNHVPRWNRNYFEWCDHEDFFCCWRWVLLWECCLLDVLQFPSRYQNRIWWCIVVYVHCVHVVAVLLCFLHRWKEWIRFYNICCQGQAGQSLLPRVWLWWVYYVLVISSQL